MKILQLFFKTNDSFAPLILRLFMGAVMFPHGAQKLLGWFGGQGFGATMHSMSQMLQIPAGFVFLDIITEFFGAIALVLGFCSRLAAFGIGIIMLVAISLVHVSNGFFMNWTGHQKGEGIEYHLLMLAIVLAVIIQGGGKWALDGLIYRKLASKSNKAGDVSELPSSTP